LIEIKKYFVISRKLVRLVKRTLKTLIMRWKLKEMYHLVLKVL
jgi:hypothetical protein